MQNGNQTARPNSSTNLRNRVNKLSLPKTKPLLPLFEVISNSIHAIDERLEKTTFKQPGKITIKVIRNGDESVLSNLPSIDNYPIHSFEVTDNGIGLNNDNYSSFQEFDSEYKIEIGGKGIGRLVCLKAFQSINIESIYLEDGIWKIRAFGKLGHLNIRKPKRVLKTIQKNLPTNEILQVQSLLFLNMIPII